MTNIEALKMLKAKRECILKEIDPSGGCDDEKCDDCDLNYEQGCMGEQAEALHIAIESLEAWEKIRAEIKTNTEKWWYGVNDDCFMKLSDVLEIIDKYRESEDKE